eukprot:1067154_1
MGQTKSTTKSDKDGVHHMPKAQQMLTKQIREFNNTDYCPRSKWILSNGITLHIAGGDVTKFHGDAIVNSANEKMLGGGGVDGAIHRAAGDMLCQYIKDNITTLPNEPYKRCLTGNAIITPGFLLNTPFVIHAAGPKYYVDDDPHVLLQSCYRSCLELADNNELKSMAFSAISCGGFKYPKEEAMEIAFNECTNCVIILPWIYSAQLKRMSKVRKSSQWKMID